MTKLSNEEVTARARANDILARAKAALETLSALHEECFTVIPETDDDPYSPLTRFLCDLQDACAAAADLATELPEPMEGAK